MLKCDREQSRKESLPLWSLHHYRKSHIVNKEKTKPYHLQVGVSAMKKKTTGKGDQIYWGQWRCCFKYCGQEVLKSKRVIFKYAPKEKAMQGQHIQEAEVAQYD